MSHSSLVIGAGFAGLSAACHLAKSGVNVTLIDRHHQAGGRARTWTHEGYTFDLGPSWYWMPDIFDRFFKHFGKEVSELYELHRLDPSYRVVWPGGEHWDIPAGLPALRALFESTEPGAGDRFDALIKETRYIYETATQDYLLRPSVSLLEYADPRLVGEVLRLKMLSSMHDYAKRYFTHERLVRLVEWPVLFLGASAKDTSAMYSLMSYGDMALGTWFPTGGMHKIIEAMTAIAQDLGVTFRLGEPVDEIVVEGKRTVGVRIGDEVLRADSVVASADYHHVESQLLPPHARSLTEAQWNKKVMAPSSLLVYLGINKPVPSLPHHTLFFDEDLDTHMDEVYTHPKWPKKPLFYVCTPSKTDPSLAPEGCENVFLLIPLAPGLPDSDEQREKTLATVMGRLEAHIGEELTPHIQVKRTFAMRDFVSEYNAFKGNAYGMANTLLQTGPLKPPLRSKKVNGLYFAGQLTVPGPGMPPSLISGELAAKVLLKDHRLSANW